MQRRSRRQRVGIAAAALALQCVPPAPRAADVRIDVRREADAVVLEAAALIDAGVTLAWRVLTDYERYPEFIPGLLSSRVVHRHGSEVTVEQSGSAALGPLQMALDTVYEITEAPPHALRSRGVIDNVGTLDSRYTIEPRGDRVHLAYVGRLTTRSRLLRRFEEAAGRETVTRQFRALVGEIERLGAPLRPSSPSPPSVPSPP